MPTLAVDHDFIRTFGIELIAGRDFSRKFATDATEAFILNEAAVKDLGWRTPAAAVGKQFNWGGINKKGHVVGVVKDFVKLVLAANLLAWPIAYFAMNKWLQDFAYRIEIGWWVFALAGGLALLVALVTVSTQAMKAALTNPVEALRYE